MGQNSEMNENACRLCEETSPIMHSVFERVPEGQQILQLIKDFLRILIYRTDPLSKQICEDCYTNLANFSSLKRISYETLDRQKERLLECGDENNISIQLFLNALEQDNVKNNQYHNTNELGEHNESELCDELQQAIQDSLRKSKIQENHIEQTKLLNGYSESQDDDSQASSQNKLHETDSSFSMSHNAESQSDIELCDSDAEFAPRFGKVSGKRLHGDKQMMSPVSKRRRFIGPKSRVKQRKDNYLRLYRQQEFRKNVIVQYNPLSLLSCALNVINKQNLPDHEYEHYVKTEVNEVFINGDLQLEEENICNYCEKLFMNVNSLAVHECSHMYVVLGDKVDDPVIWNGRKSDALVRNKWFNSINCENETDEDPPREEENFEDSTGRVNVINPEDVLFRDPEEADNDHQDLLVARDNMVMKGEVVLIDTKATVNGIPLAEIPKDDRRTLYKSVTVNGIKRKFCPLCRYTFKDNWAIESHYFSTACHYTCRFCGVRFNKQRHEFDPHVKQHILAGDTHTTKIFASRKFQSTPRVINENRMKARPPPTVRTSYTPKIQPLKMKQLFERKLPKIEIKKEPGTESPTFGFDAMRSEGKPQSQAYFCRKCYQVFFKLDEFNVHVVSCKGTAFKNAITSTNPPTPKPYPHMERSPKYIEREPEKFSPTGRPMRNCVREIGTYADDPTEELEIPFAQMKKFAPVKSNRGYECGMCSSCFPTVHSRNSHMRIHKAAIQQLNSLSRKSINIIKTRPENLAKKMVNISERQNIQSFSKFGDIKIKQEPMEPIVEIHEQPSPASYPTSIGAVSITPIPNSSHSTKLDPSIMKLVQNNPNLTIKSMVEQNSKQNLPMINPLDGDAKCYRCLSCSKPFANKSNLYFHKKNQCSGSKYPCPFCKKRFGTEAAYSSHIYYNHPE
ncbi:hypothetical protein RI129_010974 [Pyrocoelia pectoralis]|uniref:Uncharacterized protein n=1 Tax=Pyrocoelia pectoralis TaxID=417401 RepID=A0AAN7ZIE1_9COLE